MRRASFKKTGAVCAGCIAGKRCLTICREEINIISSLVIK
jgi:CO dehydrogenase/acetyl-CoA synthase alpha subunit